jgi:hypothetical protein
MSAFGQTEGQNFSLDKPDTALLDGMLSSWSARQVLEVFLNINDATLTDFEACRR